MKRVIAVLALSLMMTGCSPAPSIIKDGAASQEDPSASQKINVVTSFYPLYEIAVRIGGDHVKVRNLVPPGAEPHDYDLTPKDVESIYASKVLLVNGLGLEPWLDKLLPDLRNSQVMVVDESKTVDAQKDVLLSYDPHLWLDPVQYGKEVDAFAQTLSDVDSPHRDYYLARAKIFRDELTALDQQYRKGLQNCALRQFVTNHAAFGYLARRYDLEMVAIAGLSPDAEPSPKVLAQLTDLLKQKSVKYILVETLVSPKIAETLAREVGAQILVMNPLEGLTNTELEGGKNYISVMEDNLKNLQIAMDCR